MLQLRNDSPFAASVGRFPDPDGIDTLFAVVKGTFTLAATPSVVDEQPPVVAGPEHHGDDPARD